MEQTPNEAIQQAIEPLLQNKVNENQRKVILNQDDGSFNLNKIMANPRYFNTIITSKYTALNFVPLNLFNQFKKAANVYFLLIGFMQTIPSITISNGQPVMALPLTLVVIASMLKDAFEDHKRHKSDKGENMKECQVYNQKEKKFMPKHWMDIGVGQLVKIHSEEFVPADVLLLRTSDAKSICYVETKGLDGETNLKIKSVQKDIANQIQTVENVGDIQGHILCEKPNSAIYKYEGFAQINGIKEKISLNSDYLLLRGMSLQNTEFIYGVVINTGDDTKIMQNSARPKYKFSSLEKLTNLSIAFIICLQIVLALLAASIGTSWIVHNDEMRTIAKDPKCFDKNGILQNLGESSCAYAYYLGFNSNNDHKNGGSDVIKTLIQKIGTWILIFTNFVPISLMVSLEIVKLFQANFMGYDWTMYDDEQDMEMRAQASNLNEELGQVEYVFSDKTGTLTQNIMEFRKFTAGGISYGLDDQPTETQLDNVNFYDPHMYKVLGDKNHKDHASLERCLVFLACCHTIIIDEKKGRYNAASPDELALVNAAKQFGYVFEDRDADDNIVINDTRNGRKLKYQLLNICEFTSTRKRMSCIFKDPQGQIVVMCKGADSVIAELLTQDSIDTEHQKTQPIVDNFARIGLRTLYLAEKMVSIQDYDVWAEKSRLSKLEVVDREEAVAKVDSEIEDQLTLIGSTAIEDKLQWEVSDTIQFMKQTGIKVWVLTGDKVETAINIGLSAGLLDNDSMDQHIIIETNKDELTKNLDRVKKDIATFGKQRKQAIVVAGASLLLIDGDDDLRELFLAASDNSDVLLACRVSPKQKADIVNMIRKRFPKKVTLSIGDGANDVNMILQAHVGVGILGKEGQQAARSADYAIGQFRHLKPLMFIHGREAYRRNSMLVKYNFYKNVLYVMTQYYFGFWSAFSGETLYDPFIYQLYNITMTSLPIMYYALFDFQFSKELFLKKASLYKIGMNSECYGVKIFVGWLLLAMWHAIIIFMCCLWAIDLAGSNQSNGKSFGFWLSGHTVYGACVIVANIQLLHKFYVHDGYNLIPFILMITAYFLFLWLMNTFTNFSDVYGIFAQMFDQWPIWLSFLVCTCQCTTQELFLRSYTDLIANQETTDQRTLVEMKGKVYTKVPEDNKQVDTSINGANPNSQSSESHGDQVDKQDHNSNPPLQKRPTMGGYAFSNTEGHLTQSKLIRQKTIYQN